MGMPDILNRLNQGFEQLACGRKDTRRSLIGLLLLDQIGRLGIQIDAGKWTNSGWRHARQWLSQPRSYRTEQARQAAPSHSKPSGTRRFLRPSNLLTERQQTVDIAVVTDTVAIAADQELVIRGKPAGEGDIKIQRRGFLFLAKLAGGKRSACFNMK